VRRGAALGVPTPVNAALVEAVRAIESRRQRSSIDSLRVLHDRVIGARASHAAAA
jgi:hypothetical protein